MSATTITLVALLLSSLSALLGWAIYHEERRKRSEWRPDGAGAWWHRPLPAIGLRLSVRGIDDPSPSVVTEAKDVRRVR